MLVLLLGSNIGNFDRAGGRGVPRADPRRAGARRPAAARRRSRQAGARSAARLRRSARRDRGVQQEPAGPHQPRARRRLRSRRRSRIARSGTRTSSAIEMHLVSAPRPAGAHRRPRTSTCASRAASGSGRRAPTSTTPDGIIDMGAEAGFATRDQWIDAEAVRADAAHPRCQPDACRSGAVSIPVPNGPSQP